MKHVGWVTAVFSGLLTLSAAPTNADGDLPVAARTRIVLHGVDCSVDHEAVCLEDQPVFDEVFDTLDWGERSVVILTKIENERDLSQGEAEAVRDYVVAGGVAPRLVGIQGVADSERRDGQIDLQLLRSSQ